MQTFQLLDKHGAGSNYTLKQHLKSLTTTTVICLVKSKYSKVLQTALYHQNHVVFEVPKQEGVRPPTPSRMRHWCFRYYFSQLFFTSLRLFFTIIF